MGRLHSFRAVLGLLGLLAAAAHSSEISTTPAPAGYSISGVNDSARVPLTDLGSGTYLGFTGGLYPGGTNRPPRSHHQSGLASGVAIQPLDYYGQPSNTGRIVLLSIGMSNTTQEFCSIDSSQVPCTPWSFIGQATTDAAINQSTLVMVNGARSGQVATTWDAPEEANYDRVLGTRLTPLGLSERQVQAAWVKVTHFTPSVSLPDPQADAYSLLTDLGEIVRAMRTRYPNLQQVFLSSRIYAGYANININPEPFAYETGFAVKWLIEAQIRQATTGVVDARAGDLGPTVAPWLAWGPYLWANGTQARADGLTWELIDFEGDGTHPARGGETKVANQLLTFFKSSPYTRCWFLSADCPAL